MEYYDVISRRRMVRAFTDEAIDEAVIDRLVRAGLEGPSAGFSQGFEFLVLEAPEDRDRFWSTNEHNPQPPEVRSAPLVVVLFASKEAYLDRYAEPDKGWTDRDEGRWPVPYWYIDTGFATVHILLATVAEDLGALFFGLQTEDWPELREIFGVPERYDPIGAVAIGHPAEERIEGSAATRERKAIGEVVHAGRWGEPYTTR